MQIGDDLLSELGGPYILYKAIQSYHRRNPLVLGRLLRRSQNSRSSVSILDIHLGRLDFSDEGEVVFGLCTVNFSSVDPLSSATVLDCEHVAVVRQDCGPKYPIQLRFRKHATVASLLLVICFVGGNQRNNRSEGWRETVLLRHLGVVLADRSSEDLGLVIELLPKHIKSSTKQRPYDSLEDTCDNLIDNIPDRFGTGVGLFGNDFRVLSLTRLEDPTPRSTPSDKSASQDSVELRLGWASALAKKPKSSEVPSSGSSGSPCVFFHFIQASFVSSADCGSDSADSGSSRQRATSPLPSTQFAAPGALLQSHILYCGKALVCPWCVSPDVDLFDNAEGYRARVLEKASRDEKRHGGVGRDNTRAIRTKRKRGREGNGAEDRHRATERSATCPASSQPCNAVWSLASCDDLAALLGHLRAFHGHFSYEVVADANANMHFLMSRVVDEGTWEGGRTAQGDKEKREGFTFYGGDWRDMLSRNGLPPVQVLGYVLTKARCDTQMLRKLKRQQLESASALSSLPLSRESWNDGNGADAVTLDTRGDMLPFTQSNHARQYYHCSGCPVESWEVDYDSDNDASARWMQLMSNDLLDEYEDISEKEKTFMKMWNTFVNSFPLHADMYVRYGVVLFARRMAPHLVDRGLRHIFLVHLISMWDFSLIAAADIIASMNIVDSYKALLLASSEPNGIN